MYDKVWYVSCQGLEPQLLKMTFKGRSGEVFTNEHLIYLLEESITKHIVLLALYSGCVNSL